MVLESLVNPFKVERTPHKLFLVGVLYSTIALMLSYWIFRQHSSLLMVFLTVLACIPIMYAIMKYEEEKDTRIVKEAHLLKEHAKAIKSLMFLFFGITTAYTFWYIALPNHVTEVLFSVQAQTITSINQGLTAQVITSDVIFWKILTNNIKVLLFCVLFSFAYGAGAIFILVWNASVIAAALGNFIRTKLAVYTAATGFTTLGAYFSSVSLGILRYGIHGIPEIVAYFVAGLAGGIISIAVINHDVGTPFFNKILKDAGWLMAAAFGIILMAALLEVFVTPLFF